MISQKIVPAGIDDLRLSKPRCPELSPVETVHENPWFTVRNRGGYFTTEYTQSQVIVLPVIDNRAVIMVRVKRPVIADSTLELPAGGLRPGEIPQAGASRELHEETGILADTRRFFPLLPIANSPNRNPNLIHVFQVFLEQHEYNQRDVHDNEIDDVILYSFKEIREIILTGKLFVGAPLAILGRFLLEQACPSEQAGSGPAVIPCPLEKC